MGGASLPRAGHGGPAHIDQESWQAISAQRAEEKALSPRRASSLEELDNCPCAGVSLDRLIQPAILTILARGELHGYKIVQRIAEIEGHKPDPTGVYRALRTMEGRDLVVSGWGPSDSGPAKKSYQITMDGMICLARWVETLEKHSRVIHRLIARARWVTGLDERLSPSPEGPRR